MPPGGRRPGAGRPKGTTGIPLAQTATKSQQREAHRRVIEKYAERMIRSQVAAAIGIGHVFTRDAAGKFTRIVDFDHADRLLTQGTEGKDYWIFMKDPSTQAFTALMDRAFDKPKEQEQEIILTADQALIDALNMGRKRARELRAGTPEPPVIDVTPDPPGSDTVQ